MKNPKISIIVPVYNVQEYLHICLRSLVGSVAHFHACRDFGEDIEIIVIDDGSTDRSGAIVDLYAEQYEYFKVFHTDNHGLSAARNFGIEQSKGDYLMFVDSDDWVDSSFIEVPYRVAVSAAADMVIFQLYQVDSKGRVSKRPRFSAPDNHRVHIIDHITAVDQGGVIAWNKLYKRNLFDSIRYPEGRVYEDIATTHKLIYEAGRIAIIDDRLIYNVYRSDSISHKRSSANKIDAILSALQRYDDLISMGYPEDKALTILQNTSLSSVGVMEPVLNNSCATINTSYDPDHNYSGEELYCIAEKIVDEIQGIPKSFTKKKKCMLAVWKINKQLFHAICRACGKKVIVQ